MEFRAQNEAKQSHVVELLLGGVQLTAHIIFHQRRQWLEFSPFGHIRFKELLDPLHSKTTEAEVRAGWV